MAAPRSLRSGRARTTRGAARVLVLVLLALLAACADDADVGDRLAESDGEVTPTTAEGSDGEGDVVGEGLAPGADGATPPPAAPGEAAPPVPAGSATSTTTEQIRTASGSWSCTALEGAQRWSCEGLLEGRSAAWSCFGRMDRNYECHGDLGDGRESWNCGEPYGGTPYCVGSVVDGGPWRCTQGGRLECTDDGRGTAAGTWRRTGDTQRWQVEATIESTQGTWSGLYALRLAAAGRI